MKPQISRTSPAILLVVASNPVELLGLAGILDQYGHQCICARNEVAAKQAAGEEPLDLLVLDVSDDGEAALRLVAELRQFPAHAKLPVLLLVDARWNGLQQRTEGMHAVRCLFRPIDPRVLGDMTQQMLWMPALMAGHRQRGTRPIRPGWVQL